MATASALEGQWSRLCQETKVLSSALRWRFLLIRVQDLYKLSWRRTCNNSGTNSTSSTPQSCIKRVWTTFYLLSGTRLLISSLVNTQILLLVVGYVYRSSPKSVAALGRSSVYLNAISNRLSASSPRSHFLGMIVGTAISNLIDKPENKMLFTTEEMDSAEARWYLSLTQVQDKIGTLNDLHDTPRRAASESKGIKSSGSNSQKPSKGAKTSKIISIEEVSDNDADNVDDDEFQPYEKPDSDEEDEEEDPTLVQRNKVTVPVYVAHVAVRIRTNNIPDTSETLQMPSGTPRIMTGSVWPCRPPQALYVAKPVSAPKFQITPRSSQLF